MGNKQTTTRCRTRDRPGFIGRPCKKCGLPMAKEDRIIVTDTQTSWSRGDDIVTAKHEDCRAAAEGMTQP